MKKRELLQGKAEITWKRMKWSICKTPEEETVLEIRRETN